MTRPAERTGSWIVGCAALVCGFLGLVAGFIRGLTVYAPTAWAAAFEVGIPAAVAGLVIGLGVAGVRNIVRRIRARCA
jgi:hypothetical protein